MSRPGPVGQPAAARAVLLAAGVALASIAAMVGPLPSYASCQKARIGGRSVCIAAGQSCSPRYAAQYRRYHLVCAQQGHTRRYRLVGQSLRF